MNNLSGIQKKYIKYFIFKLLFLFFKKSKDQMIMYCLLIFFKTGQEKIDYSEQDLLKHRKDLN